MLRTVIPVRSASSRIVISPFANLSISGPAQRQAPAVHLGGGIGADKGDRVGEVLGWSERRELLARVLLAHPRGEDRVDDDDVGGRMRALEAVGVRQGPGLGGRLGRGV